MLLCISNSIAQDNTIPSRPINVRELPSDFKDDYGSEKYNYTEYISFLDRLQTWFIDLLSKSLNLNKKNTTDFIGVVIYTFLTIIIVAVIYYLVKLLVNKEGRWLFGKNPEADNDINLEEVQNIKEEDFKELIKNAESKQDYRLAIKYYYLLVLKKMDLAEKIKYDSQKTTHDYLLYLEGSQYYKAYSKIAYYFTYVWYGEFSIDINEYQTASSSFVELLNQFNND